MHNHSSLSHATQYNTALTIKNIVGRDQNQCYDTHYAHMTELTRIFELLATVKSYPDNVLVQALSMFNLI